MRGASWVVLVGLICVLGGCGESPTQPPPPPPAIDSPAAVVSGIADAYQWLDFSRFERFISQEPGAEFEFELASPLANGQTGWDAASTLNLHQRMLVAPASKASGAGVDASPVPAALRLARVAIVLTPTVPFSATETPQGLDPDQWRAYAATYAHDVFFDTQGSIDYQARGQSQFVVIEDLSKSEAEPGRFLLYSWHDLGTTKTTAGARTAAVESVTWGNFQVLYAGGGPASSDEFIQSLADAYRRRNYPDFETLFPASDSDTPYRFILSDPLPDGSTNWGLTEELRIHRRMFNPENTLPGEKPVPTEYWLSSITISLTQIGNFAERPDLYESPSNPDGLDPNVWKAQDCQYQAIIYFDTQSTTDFRVDCKVNFVVLDLRARLEGVPGKYCLYRWEDLGNTGVVTRDGIEVSATWGTIKTLYR